MIKAEVTAAVSLMKDDLASALEGMSDAEKQYILAEFALHVKALREALPDDK